MQIIKSTKELQSIRRGISTKIGFVPTMGALHEGHISLIKKAKKQNDIIFVSIFINPKQFSANEDFSSYPKKEESDIKICELCKVDYLFIPEISSIYSQNEVLIKAPNQSYILEGFSRTDHFNGVLQVVLKLFGLIQAHNSYFGKKDAQQLFLIQKMVNDFFINTQIIACETLRQNDGLAISSRNIYLSKEERKEASLISKSLYCALKIISKNEFDTSIIKNEMINILKDLNVEYIEFVNKDFKEIKKVQLKNTIILIVVKFKTIRLLDNIWV